MRFIIKYVSIHKFYFILAFIIKFLGTTMDLIIPWILAHIIDYIVPLGKITLIIYWGIAMVLCALFGLFANIIANRLTSKSAILFIRDLRMDVFQKILSLSCEQIDQISIPSIISRISMDTYNLHQFVSLIQRMGSRAPILLIGSIIMSLTLDAKLALIMILMLPIIFIIVIIITKKGVPLFNESRKHIDIFTRSIRENITGTRIIKAFVKGSYETNKFNKVNIELKKSNIKAESLMALSSPLINLCLNVGIVFVILFGAILVNKGYSRPGTIIAFISYFSILVTALLTVTRTFIMSSKSIASSNRLKEIMDLTSDKKVINSEKGIDREPHIEFENVSFSYVKKVDNLRNISFKLKKGDTLGIIGSTGAGKTTLINLLLALYKADKGSVKINGTNINDIPSDILYNKFGIVFQDDILFEKSIKDNISFGRKIKEEEIAFAARCAQLIEFIENKEDKFEYKVAIRGKNLSGGQKQRLLIARALASYPEILIFDDSLSALDYKTDSLLRNEIKEHYKNTTKIIIAQRISSIMDADHIMVLNEGEVMGYGTHKELIRTSDLYKKIRNSQTEFKEDILCQD